MTLTEFLTARVAEEDAYARGWNVMSPRLRRRLRRDVEAKRRVLHLHVVDCLAGDDEVDDEYFCVGCATTTKPRPDEVTCPTLTALATPYADHPDYRSEWKP